MTYTDIFFPTTPPPADAKLLQFFDVFSAAYDHYLGIQVWAQLSIGDKGFPEALYLIEDNVQARDAHLIRTRDKNATVNLGRFIDSLRIVRRRGFEVKKRRSEIAQGHPKPDDLPRG